MSRKWMEKFRDRRFGTKGAVGIGLTFLLVGFLVSPGFPRPASSAAFAQVAAVRADLEQEPAMASPFTALAAKLTPSVVNVKATRVEKVGFPWPEGMQNPFGEFFNAPETPQKRQVQGAGSGVIISGDGVILTNNHVVEGAREVTVSLGEKREYKAKILGRDPKTDLAVLKIDAGGNLPAASLGDSERLNVGDWVVAIGNPFGLSRTVTTGIVSAKGRVIGAGPYDDFIQTDASINPGNSGGPLFNMKGEVIGINTAIVPEGRGIGFAIPVNTAKPLIPQLVEKGGVTRGYLGVNIQSIDPDLAGALKIQDSSGALVTEVLTGSPAEKAGIKQGDVITAFGGKAVKDPHDLAATVASTGVGKEVAVTVIRDGKKEQLTAAIGKLGSEETASETGGQPAHGKWGLRLQDLNPDAARRFGLKTDRGVAVVDVQQGSPADEASIRQGDVILEVNRHPVSTAKEVIEQISGSGDKNTLLLLVQGEAGKRYVVLKQAS